MGPITVANVLFYTQRMIANARTHTHTCWEGHHMIGAHFVLASFLLNPQGSSVGWKPSLNNKYTGRQSASEYILSLCVMWLYCIKLKNDIINIFFFFKQRKSATLRCCFNSAQFFLMSPCTRAVRGVISVIRECDPWLRFTLGGILWSHLMREQLFRIRALNCSPCLCMFKKKERKIWSVLSKTQSEWVALKAIEVLK